MYVEIAHGNESEQTFTTLWYNVRYEPTDYGTAIGKSR